MTSAPRCTRVRVDGNEHRAGHEGRRVQRVPRAPGGRVRHQRHAVGACADDRRLHRTRRPACQRLLATAGVRRQLAVGPDLPGIHLREQPRQGRHERPARRLHPAPWQQRDPAAVGQQRGPAGRRADDRGRCRSALFACRVRLERDEPGPDAPHDAIVHERRHGSPGRGHAAGVRALSRQAHAFRPAGQNPHVPRVRLRRPPTGRPQASPASRSRATARSWGSAQRRRT